MTSAKWCLFHFGLNVLNWVKLHALSQVVEYPSGSVPIMNPNPDPESPFDYKFDIGSVIAWCNQALSESMLTKIYDAIKCHQAIMS